MQRIAIPVSCSCATIHRGWLRFCAGVFVALAWLVLDTGKAQAATYVLGTTNLLVGPAAGSNSVVLGVSPLTAGWSASTNAAWLHVDAGYQSGTASTNVIFSFDANPGATRSGTLTIAGLILTINQAGASYIAAGTVTTLASGLDAPGSLALDGKGNVYITDIDSNTIEEWTVASNSVTLLVPPEPNFPRGMAVDSNGNIFFSEPFGNVIKEWIASNSTVTTLVSTGLDNPVGVALDSSGNLYIADALAGEIEKWTATDSNLTPVVSAVVPTGVAVDSAGNLYIANFDNAYDAVLEWTLANESLTALVSSNSYNPFDLAVDGAGNVYFSDPFKNVVLEWSAANNTLLTLISSNLSYPYVVAADGTGNIYIADYGNKAIKELPYAFVDATAKLEPLAAGNDSLPPVLPVTENLLQPFAPTSDQSWLTITGITNGVVSFSFTANTGPARTAHITLLGQSIPVTQGVIGTPPTLSGGLLLSNGIFQFSFTNNPSGAFTVVSTADLSLPLSNWTVVGYPVESPPGMYEFTSQPTTDVPQIFYSVISP